MTSAPPPPQTDDDREPVRVERPVVTERLLADLRQSQEERPALWGQPARPAARRPVRPRT